MTDIDSKRHIRAMTSKPVAAIHLIGGNNRYSDIMKITTYCGYQDVMRHKK